MDDFYVISQDIMTCNEPYILSPGCESVNSAEEHLDYTNVPQLSHEDGDTVVAISDVEYSHCPPSEISNGKCWQMNGLWYNDHCYSISPLAHVKSSIKQSHVKLVSSDVIVRCVCVHTDVDDHIVQCQQCKTWQHGKCVLPETTLVPQNYRCEVCASKENQKQSCTKIRYVLPADRAAQAARIISKSRLLTKEELGFTKIQENVFSEELTRVLHIQQMNGSGNSTGAESLLRELHGRLVPCYRVVPQSNLSSLMQQAGHEDVPGWQLESARQLCRGEPVAEICGYVSIRAQWDEEVDFFHGYQLFYDGFEGFQLCLDANEIGNDVRFIRRSCSPTCEVRHLLCDGRLYFVIMALQDISMGVELSIPFDMAINYVESMLNSGVTNRNGSARALICACTRGKLCRLQQWRVSVANQSSVDVNMSRMLVPPGSLELYAAQRSKQHPFFAPTSSVGGAHGSRKSPLRPRSSVIQVPSVKNLSSSAFNCQNQLACRQGHHPRLAPFQQQKLHESERDRAWLQKEKALRREQEIQLLRRQRSAQASAHYRPQSASSRQERQRSDDFDHVFETCVQARSTNHLIGRNHRRQRSDDVRTSRGSGSGSDSHESNENVTVRQSRNSPPFVARRVRQNSASELNIATNKQMKTVKLSRSDDKRSYSAAPNRRKSDSKSSDIAATATTATDSDQEPSKARAIKRTSPAQSREERWLAAQIAAIERMENRKLQNKSRSISTDEHVEVEVQSLQVVDEKVSCEELSEVVTSCTQLTTARAADEVKALAPTLEKKESYRLAMSNETESNGAEALSSTSLLDEVEQKESIEEKDLVAERVIKLEEDSDKVGEVSTKKKIIQPKKNKLNEKVATSETPEDKLVESSEGKCLLRLSDAAAVKQKRAGKQRHLEEISFDQFVGLLDSSSNEVTVAMFDKVDDKTKQLDMLPQDSTMELEDSRRDVAAAFDGYMTGELHNVVEVYAADEEVSQIEINNESLNVTPIKESAADVSPGISETTPSSLDGQTRRKSHTRCISFSDSITKRRRSSGKCGTQDDTLSTQNISASSECEVSATPATGDSAAKELSREDRWTLAMWRRIQAAEERRRQKSEVDEVLESSGGTVPLSNSLAARKRYRSIHENGESGVESSPKKRPQKVECDVEMASVESSVICAASESSTIPSTTATTSVVRSPRIARRISRTMVNNASTSSSLVDSAEVKEVKSIQPPLSPIANECEFIIYSKSEQLKDPLAKYMRQASQLDELDDEDCAPVSQEEDVESTSQHQPSHQASLNLPQTPATATKKRWLYKAYQEEELHVSPPLLATSISSSGVEVVPLKKRLKIHASTADEEMIELLASCSSQSALCDSTAPVVAVENSQEASLCTNTGATFFTPSCPKKAFLMRGVALEKAKIRMSLSDYMSRRGGGAGSTLCDFMLSPDKHEAQDMDVEENLLMTHRSTLRSFDLSEEAVKEAEYEEEKELLHVHDAATVPASSLDMDETELTDEPVEGETSSFLNNAVEQLCVRSLDETEEVDASAKVIPKAAYSFLDENFEEDDVEPENGRRSIRCPLTPEDSAPESDDDNQANFEVLRPRTPDEPDTSSDDEDERNIFKTSFCARDMFSSNNASEDEDEDRAAELRTLEEIKARDAEIRTFQELQTLEREKSKIEYQIRHEEAREKRKEKERLQQTLLHPSRPLASSCAALSSIKKGAPAPQLASCKLSDSFTQQHYKHHGSVRQRPIFLSDGQSGSTASAPASKTLAQQPAGITTAASLQCQQAGGTDRLAAIQARLAANLAQLAGPSAVPVPSSMSTTTTRAPKLLTDVSHTIISMKKEISKLTVQLSEQLHQIKEASCQHVASSTRHLLSEASSGALCVQEADSTVHDELG